MSRENFDRLLHLTINHHFSKVVENLDEIANIADQDFDSDNYENAQEKLREAKQAHEQAHAYTTLLPALIEVLDQYCAGDIPEEVIVYSADEINQRQKPAATGEEKKPNQYKELISQYPQLNEIFEGEEESNSGLIKRSAINPYVLRTDGREIVESSSISARQVAIGSFYKAWLKNIPEESRPIQKKGVNHLLTKDQMVDFALFIANPPEQKGIPRTYTIQKKREQS
jgi:hypothetical protein